MAPPPSLSSASLKKVDDIQIVVPTVSVVPSGTSSSSNNNSSSSSTAAAGSSGTTTHHNNNNHHHHHQPPTRTIPQLFCLFAVSFSYALMFATMSNIVIAKEVDRLASTSQTTWVGVIMAVGALSQIATPICGAWSDRYGSRDPFLKAGTVLVLIGICILTGAGMVSSMIVLFVSQIVISCGLSIQYAMITVTLHDHVNEEQIGVGSSAMASLGILGAGCGYSLFAIGLDMNYIFGVYALTTVICFSLTMSSMNGISLMNSNNISAAQLINSGGSANGSSNNNNNSSSSSKRGKSDDDEEEELSKMIDDDNNNNTDGSAGGDGGEMSDTTAHNNNNSNRRSGSSSPSKTHPHHHNSNNNNTSSASSASASSCGSPINTAKVCEVFVHALTVPSPFTFPDFALALSSRALFNAGLSCQGFLVFFFRDVAKIGSFPPEQVVSRLAVLALLGGLVGAVPAGYLSDRWGKKPVIFIASFVCIAAILSFPFLSTTSHFDLIGLLFGFGNVSFLSVDYALGVQSLPRKTGPDGQRKPVDAAKDLGVFALSATVGMLLGQLVFAGILEKFSSIEPVGKNGAPESRYAPSGFMITFGVASFFFLLSAVCAGMIKQLK